MPTFRPLRTAFTLGFLLAAGCETYAPAPVDLAAHAAAFAARLPDPAALRELLADRAAAPAGAPFDLADGLSLAEGQLVALWFHPDCRLARQRAVVAAAAAEHAGRPADPELDGDIARILEQVEHPWLAAGSLGLQLPLDGRLALQRAAAAGEHEEALAEAQLAELAVLDRLDAAWLRWSADRQRTELLRDLCAALDELAGMAERLAAANELTQMQARAFRLERLARGHELAAAEAGLAAGELELRALLGLHPAAPVELQPALAVPARSATDLPRAQRLADSPRLLRLRCAHATAERRLELAIRRQWPELVLRPGFAEEDAQPRLTFGFTLPLPLWNRNAAERARARAERDLAAEALRCGHEQLVQDLARAELLERTTQARRSAVVGELLPLAAQQLEDGRRLAALGDLDTLLILDALVRTHDARLQALDAGLAAAAAHAATEALFWPDGLLPPAARPAPTRSGDPR
ncbi:MAG: hypothetical protein FJ265_00945 [Planctomycetes bacterium]|nr:hypothetical protein [Planctomycetota bacterium]